jgi:hypothetical protein
VMNHETTVASPRAGPEVIEVAAFVANDRRHTSLQSYAPKFLSRRGNEVNTSR